MVRRMLCAALCAAVTLALAGCGARRAETRDPDLVVAAWIAGPPGLNPLTVTSSAATMIEDIIYSPLIDLDSNMLPRWSTSLAKSVDITDGGKRYVIHLRPARWSDGQPLDAKDVVFSILVRTNTLVLNPSASDFSLMTSARALDAHTVEVRLSKPSPAFLLDALAGDVLVLPAHLLSKFPPRSQAEATFLTQDSSFAQSPVVSGPYRVLHNVPGAYVTLERNPYYWGKPAYIARVAFRVYPQQDSLYAAVDAGEVDVTNIPPTLWRVHDRLRGPYKFLTWPWNIRFALLINFADPHVPFLKDRTVRQAIMYGIDRMFIINGIMDGQADLLNGPIPTFSTYYDKKTPHYTYDPAKARAMLEADGWKLENGVRRKNGVALKFTLKTGGATDAVASDIAELIQANMRAIGIQCEIDNEELQTYFNDLHQTKFQVALRGRILAAFPDDYLNYDSTQTRANGGNNLGSYDNPQADRLMVTTRTAPSMAIARKALDGWQMLGAEDLPEIWLYSNRLAAVVPSNMTGFGLDPRAPAALPMDVQFWRRIQSTPQARSR